MVSRLEVHDDDLDSRAREVLRAIILEHVATGEAISSRSLSKSGHFQLSPASLRNVMADLEDLGYLQQPHTSAGRVPTDAGYRVYAHQLLEQPLGAARLPIDLSQVRNEVDAALRNTTEMMSQVTNLLAVVTAPPLETAEIRHVEVLRLQPRMVMVVVITSTGGVTKSMFPFEEAVDEKLIEWATAYLNEQLGGVRLGARALRQRLFEPGLGARELEFMAALEPAFTELVGSGEQTLYVGGAARLVQELRHDDLAEINDLMLALEERAGLLQLLRGALETNRLYVRVGGEEAIPQLRGLSLVAANYGLPARHLGTVSLIGPHRMDYVKAIRSVRGAAALLSDFVEQVYE